MGYSKIIKKRCKFCKKEFEVNSPKREFCSHSCWGKYAYRNNADRRNYLKKRSREVYNSNKNNPDYKKQISASQKRYVDRNREYFRNYMRNYMRRKRKIKPENFRVAIDGVKK